MILVIPTRNEIAESLRFAIRSICLHNPIEKCILIGGKPEWYTGIHISFPEYQIEKKEENIRDKVIAASRTIKGDFLFANDDHFMLAPYQGVHNKGLLSDTIKGRNPNGSYTKLLQNTKAYFGDVPNVDTHCPMMMNSELVDNTNFYWPLWGLGFKTTYAEVNKIQSTYYPDTKLDFWNDDDKGYYFSIGQSFNRFDKLAELFPNKSKFEL